MCENVNTGKEQQRGETGIEKEKAMGDNLREGGERLIILCFLLSLHLFLLSFLFLLA